MAKKIANQLGAGCMTLFGLPFLLAGLFVLSIGVKAIFTSATISDWEVVDGRVKSVNRGDNGQSIAAELAYRWEGVAYTTLELNPYSMKEEGWESEMFSMLNKAKETESAVPVLVNPDNPAEAVLQSDQGTFAFVFPLMFGGIFALVGGGVIAGGVFGLRHTRKATKLQQTTPDEPWRWREDWVSGRVKSEQKYAVLGLAAFALFWNGISWTVALGFLTSDEPKEWFVYPIIGIFPLIGLALIGVLIKAWRTAMITGKSVFVFSPEHGPFRRGGEVTGRIETDRVIPSNIARELEVGLRLVNKSKIRSGKNTRTLEDVVWSKMVAASSVMIPGGTRINLKLRIPRKLSDTEDPVPGGHQIGETEKQWEVLLRGKDAGKAVDLSYAIPVFGEVDSEQGLDGEELIESSSTDDGYDLNEPLTAEEMKRVGVDRFVSKDRSITYVRNAKGRSGIGGVFLLVGIVFLAAAWFGIRPENPVFATFFGLGGLASALGGLATITGRSALRIDPAKRQLVKMSKCFGIKSMKAIAFEDISSVRAISNGSVNDKPMMVLEVKSKTTKGFRAIGMMLDSVAARKLAQQVSNEIGRLG